MVNGWDWKSNPLRVTANEGGQYFSWPFGAWHFDIAGRSFAKLKRGGFKYSKKNRTENWGRWSILTNVFQMGWKKTKIYTYTPTSKSIWTFRHFPATCPTTQKHLSTSRCNWANLCHVHRFPMMHGDVPGLICQPGSAPSWEVLSATTWFPTNLVRLKKTQKVIVDAGCTIIFGIISLTYLSRKGWERNENMYSRKFGKLHLLTLKYQF